MKNSLRAFALASLLATAHGSGQEGRGHLSLELYNSQSTYVGMAQVPIPQDRFRRQFRSYAIAYAVGAEEIRFRDLAHGTTGGKPQPMTVHINSFDGGPAAIWFEYLDGIGGRFFTEPTEEKEVR